MATVIRVKRRIDEEPLSAFVLNSKKRRFEDLDDGATEPKDSGAPDATSTTVVKFAGTVQNQDDIASHIRKLTKAEAIDATNHVRRPAATNLAARQRNAQRQNAQEDRFKIVNCFRTIDGQHPLDDGLSAANSAGDGSRLSEIDADSAAGGSKLTVVDIEKNDATSTADVPAATSTNVAVAATAAVSPSAAEPAQYVYDLYFPDAAASNAHMDIFIEDLLSIEPLDQLTYGSARDNGQPDTSDESDDSNDENNWRNDYPDTDEDNEGRSSSDNSVNERDMRRAFDTLDLDNELSTDDEAFGAGASGNAFVHSIEEEDEHPDVDARDAERYGVAYARYKARLRRELNDTSIDGSDDDKLIGSDNDSD